VEALILLGSDAVSSGPCFYGGFGAILFSVCNHLGDLLGAGMRSCNLRKLLFYPNIHGVPKWFATLPPSRGKLQARIAQAPRNSVYAGNAVPTVPVRARSGPEIPWRQVRKAGPNDNMKGRWVVRGASRAVISQRQCKTVCRAGFMVCPTQNAYPSFFFYRQQIAVNTNCGN
jgi:hypothetical protein